MRISDDFWDEIVSSFHILSMTAQLNYNIIKFYVVRFLWYILHYLSEITPTNIQRFVIILSHTFHQETLQL